MFFSVRGSSPATLPALLPRCVHRVPTSRARAVVAAVYHSAWPPGSGSGCTVSNNPSRGFPDVRRAACIHT